MLHVSVRFISVNGDPRSGCFYLRSEPSYSLSFYFTTVLFEGKRAHKGKTFVSPPVPLNLPYFSPSSRRRFSTLD